MSPAGCLSFIVGQGMRRAAFAICIALYAIALGCAKQPESEPASPSIKDLPKLTGKVTFRLEDGEEYHRRAPTTFEIPELARRESLKEGDIVKLLFRFFGDNESRVERMWVIVKGREGDEYFGVLDNDPFCTDQFRSGISVRFRAKHVINIWIDEAHPEVMKAKQEAEEKKTAQPGATDNPDDAQRLREDH